MRLRFALTGVALLVAFVPRGSDAQAPVAPPKLGGYVQARETYVEPTGLTATLNRARLSADGALPNRFTYRMLIEFEAGATARTPASVSLREAIVRWAFAPWAIQAGQFKTPFSREYLIPVPALETADFSGVVDSLAPKYDLGVMAEYVMPFAGLTAGVFNGEGQNAGLNRDSTVLVVTRVSVRPLAQATLAGNVARSSSDSIRYGMDVSIEQSGLFVRGEFIGQHRRGRERDDLGWYVLGTYRALPWLQLVAKQEDFQRPDVSVARRVTASTGGFNVELPGGKTRLLFNIVSRRAGFPRVRRNSAIAQVQVRF